MKTIENLMESTCQNWDEDTKSLIREWIDLPSAQFHGKSPAEMIRDGNLDEVKAYIEEIYSERIFS